MSLFVAAVEHAARTFLATLTERCCGPAGYEDSDYYAVPGPNIHGYRLDYPESPLVAREAEQEVAEPRDVDGDLWRAAAGMFRKMDSANCGYCGQPTRGVHLSTCPRAKASAVPPAAVDDPTGNSPAPVGSPTPSSTTLSASQPPVDDDSWPADSDIPPSPAGQPPTPAASAGRAESSPPEASAPTAPSGEQDWITWAIPAIQEVLAEHRIDHDGLFFDCYSIDESEPHASCRDLQDWREHVAPLIAERLDMAWRAKQSRQIIETGHDMGVSIACETFPQYRGGRS